MYSQDGQQPCSNSSSMQVSNPTSPSIQPATYNKVGTILQSYERIDQVIQATQTANYPIVPLPPDYFSAFFAMSNNLQHAVTENVMLQNQLSQKQLREEAYTKIIINNGRTYTLGRYGKFLELINAVINATYYYEYSEPPLRFDPYYSIEIDKYETLIISEKDFFSDARLINAFQRHGITVQHLSTQKNTARLLRDVVTNQLAPNRRHCPLVFYAGWRGNQDKTASWYFIFQSFATCQSNSKNDVLALLPNLSPSVTATAISQFMPVFEMIRTSFKRQLTLLLYHEAAIHTLLQQLGYAFPLAICFFSTEHNILTYFRKLLSWFNTSPIILEKLTNDFSYDLLARKDQPLLVEDSGRLNQAAKNSEILESALLNHVVPWKNKRETRSLPLQAPITLLSSRASALSCAPEVMVLDFVADDFNREVWKESADRVGQNRDYLIAFCGYTSDHIPELRKALEDGQKTARSLDEGQLTDPCLQTLGIFIGLRNFLESFFECAALNSVPFPSTDENLFGQLLDILVQTSKKAERASLPEQFIDIARNMIQKDILHIHHRNRCPVDMRGVVAFDEDRLHFTLDAFTQVCQSMMQSRPVIEAALSEAGMFSGARINKTTPLTRITIWNEHGIPKLTRVFSFERELFDVYGDPLILEEEDMQ